jgi:2,4-dienoyl-CoA reductase-like NADH-dependent reductase (Old Yellow Enzyme family)
MKEMTMRAFPKVSAPLQMKGVTIPNRIVFPPFVTNYSAHDGSISEQQINFYRRIAGAGVGLTIIGAAGVTPDGIASGMTRIDDDRYIPGLRRVFDVIREQGSVPGVQIIHPGRQTTSKITGRQTVSASAIPCPVSGETPKELTVAEIEELEDGFARATGRAVAAGAEVIEFHAAHGYLLFQFLSPLSNVRQDRYGGSLENRARFALNAVDKARDLVGMDPVLGFRISAEEFVEGGVTIAESRVVARMMAEHSSDFIHVSAGTPAAGPRRFEEMEAGTYVRLAEGIKEVVDVPVICVGWVTGLDRAEAILAQGSADLVAIGRALVADHDLLKKCYADQAADVVECTHCGVCLESLYANEPMRCAQNPDL